MKMMKIVGMLALCLIYFSPTLQAQTSIIPKPPVQVEDIAVHN